MYLKDTPLSLQHARGSGPVCSRVHCTRGTGATARRSPRRRRRMSTHADPERYQLAVHEAWQGLGYALYI